MPLMLETLQALLLLTQPTGTAAHFCHACVFGVEVFVVFGFDVFVITSITRTCGVFFSLVLMYLSSPASLEHVGVFLWF